MHSKRKLISLFLIAAILLFCITGCGGNSQQNPTNVQNPTEINENADDQNAEDESNYNNQNPLISAELKDFLD